MNFFERRCLAPPLCRDNDHTDKKEEGGDEGEERAMPRTRNTTTTGMNAAMMTITKTLQSSRRESCSRYIVLLDIHNLRTLPELSSMLESNAILFDGLLVR